MNIKIPKQFVDNSEINELIIEFVGKRNYKVPPNNELISVPDSVFNNCSSIVFHVENKNSQKTTLALEKHQVLFPKDLSQLYPAKFDEVIQSQFNKKVPIKIFSPEDYLRVNENALIADKDVAWQLMKQSAISNNLSTEVIGTKKLIYYTVYGEWYIKLLEKSIESLIETSIASFDILIISDGESQKKIKNLNVMQNNTLNVFYHTVNVPVDGIAASMNKTIIYDFELIDNYSHVLFLDCDILALKDVDMIFNLLTESEKFYCVCNPQVNSGGYLGIFHGLDYNKEEVFELAVNQRQRPFNAGQFAFLNTARMRKHFKNINYFIANWNGPYFFEQVFMNIYFLYANCCNNVLSDSVCLANASVNNTEAKHSSGDILIHFIAPALSGEVKLDYLTQYFDAHKL